jgi:3-hydroxyisobutyrate dehydrogenase
MFANRVEGGVAGFVHAHHFVGKAKHGLFNLGEGRGVRAGFQRIGFFVADTGGLADAFMGDDFVVRIAQNTRAGNGDFAEDRVQRAAITDGVAHFGVAFKVRWRMRHHPENVFVVELVEQFARAVVFRRGVDIINARHLRLPGMKWIFQVSHEGERYQATCRFTRNRRLVLEGGIFHHPRIIFFRQPEGEAMVIGYIGIGDMGGPMARNILKAGFDVVVCDLDPVKVDALVADGATAADTPEAVASQADIVMACLNTVAASHAVAKAVSGGSAVRIFVDQSTTGPTVAKELRSYFEGTDIQMVDAPVSGMIEKAVDGTLTVISSGPESAFNDVKPLFDAMGSNVFWLGDIPGGGQMMKVLNNYINNVQAVGTSEGVTMGLKFGLDPQTMFNVLNVSTGRNSQTEGKLAEAVITGVFSGGANMKISQKDIGLGVEEGERMGAATNAGRAARDTYNQAIADGGDKERSTAILKHVALKAGVTVEKP